MAEYNKVIFVLTLILVCWLSGVFSVCRKRCRRNNPQPCGDDNYICKNDSAEPPVERCYLRVLYADDMVPCGNSTLTIQDVSNLGSCSTTRICLQGSIDPNCKALGGYLNATIYLGATNTFQNLTSPGYDDGYCDNMDILWLIFAQQGKKIEIMFTDFVTEGLDFVKITDGICNESRNCAAELGSFSGNTDPDIITDINGDYYYNYYEDLTAQLQTPIRSSSIVMTINFYSDHSITVRGFSLKYRQVD